MNQDVLEGKWRQMRGRVKEYFGDLTDDEITWVEGKSDRLIGLLQERYGYTKEQAREQVNRFVEKSGARDSSSMSGMSSMTDTDTSTTTTGRSSRSSRTGQSVRSGTSMTGASTEYGYGEERTVAALFGSHDDASRAISDLNAAGFSNADIGFVTLDSGDYKVTQGDTETTVGSAASGAVAGGVLGGIAGLLAGLAGLAIPGIGPILVGGALATTLGTAGATAVAGAGIGAVAGGLIGALADMGIPEEDARYYEEHLRAGRTLVTVRAGTRVMEAVEILRTHGGDLHQGNDAMNNDLNRSTNRGSANRSM